MVPGGGTGGLRFTVESGVSEGVADQEEVGRLLQEEAVAGKEVCWED